MRSSGGTPSGSGVLRSSQIFGMLALPAIAHALDVAIGSAQQQHHRQQRIAARQHREVLHHDGFEQRRHQLVRRHAHLLQAVDIGLGEHAALAGHRVQLDALVAHLAELRRTGCAAWR